MNLHSVRAGFSTDMTHIRAMANDAPNHFFQKAAMESEVAFLTKIFFRGFIKHLTVGLGTDITCSCTVSK